MPVHPVGLVIMTGVLAGCGLGLRIPEQPAFGTRDQQTGFDAHPLHTTVAAVNDAEFLDHVADTLIGLEGVEAVSLGGSRAQGSHRPDSDWDLGIHYRGHFDPQRLRDLGWPGEVADRS